MEKGAEGDFRYVTQGAGVVFVSGESLAGSIKNRDSNAAGSDRRRAKSIRIAEIYDVLRHEALRKDWEIRVTGRNEQRLP